MTRIESANQRGDQVNNLQTEIYKIKKGLKKKQNRRILSCGSCAIVFLIIFLILAGFSSYVLAKSGIVQIPYLSDWSYQEPRPAYIVQTELQNESQIDILAKLKDSLVNSFVNINNALNSKVNLQLNDRQLTSLLSDQVVQNSSLKNRIDYLQVAVLPQNLELFIKLRKPQNTILIFEIVPKIDNNKIDLEVVSFKIGNLKMPNFIGKAIVAPLGEKILNMVITPFLGFGKIQEIKLDYGKVIVGVLITNIQGLF